MWKRVEFGAKRCTSFDMSYRGLNNLRRNEWRLDMTVIEQKVQLAFQINPWNV